MAAADTLSEVELEVACLLVDDVATEKIAQTLGIEQSTVLELRRHIHHQLALRGVEVRERRKALKEWIDESLEQTRRAKAWKWLIAERDAKVRQIYELTREIHRIDAELDANPPPANVCVGVWQPKRRRAA